MPPRRRRREYSTTAEGMSTNVRIGLFDDDAVTVSFKAAPRTPGHVEVIIANNKVSPTAPCSSACAVPGMRAAATVHAARVKASVRLASQNVAGVPMMSLRAGSIDMLAAFRVADLVVTGVARDEVINGRVYSDVANRINWST